jgi:hypothetical protein
MLGMVCMYVKTHRTIHIIVRVDRVAAPVERCSSLIAKRRRRRCEEGQFTLLLLLLCLESGWRRPRLDELFCEPNLREE